MGETVYNVLFVGMGNAARSVMAESLLNYWGRGKIRGFSGGLRPAARVEPLVFQVLEDMNLPTDGLRCKNWQDFTRDGAPPIDMVVTLCQPALQTIRPLMYGGPPLIHWELRDPSEEKGADSRRLAAFRVTLSTMERCVRLIAAQDFTRLDGAKLQGKLAEMYEEMALAEAQGGMRL